MDVFRRFTRRSLARNRTRTLVTIIGIVLSMSLFTAVIEGAYSGIQFLIRSVEAEDGAFHFYYDSMDADTAKKAAEQEGVKSWGGWQQVGWAELGSENDYKPYLLIEDISDNFTDFVAVHMVDGRMPEAPDEIVLPRHLMTNGGMNYKIGDTLTLNVGRRMSEGYELTVHNPINDEMPEEITDTQPMTYTVVGICERLSGIVEDYSSPSYIALTKGGGRGSYTVFIKLANIRRTYEFISVSPINAEVVTHDDLLRMNGTVRSAGISNVIYGFAGILMFLICFGSISLIYNSFSISVSERTKQFGILKSVGATKKQIRSSVLYEALVLAGIGIPIGLVLGCAGIGITLYLLRDSFNLFVNYVANVQMKLVLNIGALCIAALVCLVTILISAWIPARKTDKVSAIDAIRQSNDVKIKGREVRTSRLTRKLFGFEGMMASKNFKRNKKRYRSTVISLFLSLVLFISASSFSSYLTDAVGGATGYVNGVDISYYTVGDDKPEPEKLMAMLSDVQGVKQGTYLEKNSFPFMLDREAVEPELIAKMGYDGTEEQQIQMYIEVDFLDDASFKDLCAQSGIDPAEYLNPANPRGILYNTVSGRDNERFFTLNMISPSVSLPLTVTCGEIRQPEGYIQYGTEVDEQGNTNAVYYPEEYMSGLWQTDGEPDRTQAKLVPIDEAMIKDELTISRMIDEPYYTNSAMNPIIYYPYSLKENVLSGELLERLSFETDYYFKAENHAQVHETMEKLLTEEGMDTTRLYDEAENGDIMRSMVVVVNVFTYGFIILISLIAVANVFNTISTNISLRRREFAMLKSIGMGSRGFNRMMNYECIIYGMKGLVWGLPVSVLMTYAIYKVTSQGFDSHFYIPWYSVLIAVGSVFAVVFATMLYSMSKIKKDNPIDALKNENL